MADRFWVLGAGTWDNSNTANWSATSGGAGGASAPTSADDVIFDLNSGTGVVTTASSAAANSITYNSNTLTELLFGDNLDISASTSGAFTLTAGTIDLAGFTLTVKSFSSNNSNTRAIQFGTGNITTTGSGTAWTTSTATNLTYTGTPTVNISNNSATATTVTAHTANGTESNSFDFNFTTGTYTLTLTTGARVKNLDFTGFTGTWSPGTSTCQIFGNFTLSSGMTFTNGSGVFTFSATSGIQLITSAGKTLNPITQNGVGGTVQLASGTTTLGSNRTYTFTAGTLDLSTNTAILSTGLFSSSNANTRAIQFGTGNITTTGTGLIWTTSDASNLTYTGTPTVNISNSGASSLSMNVHITNGTESNSFDFNFTTGTYTLSIGSGSRFRSLNFTGFAGSWSPGGNSFTFYGSLTFVSGMTFTTGTGTFTFSATSGTQIITPAGKTLNPITHNVAGTTLQLNGNLTCSSTFTNSGGITDLNGFDLTCGTFVCSNTTPVKAIYFGTNQISMTGNNTTVLNITSTNFSFTGTMKFVSTYTGSVGTRTFVATAVTLATSITAGAGPGFQLSFGTTATDIVTFSGQLASLDFTGYTKTWSWGTLTLYGDLTLDTGMTVTTSASVLTLSAPSGTQIINSAGKTLGPITQNTPGATVQLASDTTLGSTRTYTLDRGTLNLNNFILTTGLFSSSNANTRAIQFGTGNITVNGSSGTICVFDQLSNYTHTGSAIINVSNNSASAVTIGIATSGSSELNTPNVNVNTGTYALTINNASKFLSLNFTGFTGTWSPGANFYTFYRDVTLSSGMTYNTGTSSWTFSGLASTTAYLTSAGKTIYSIIFSGLGTTNRTLVDPLTVSNSVTLTLGTLDANNQNVTVGSFTSNSGSVRALIMGSGTWTLTGATSTANIWNVTSSGFTFNKDTANINVGVTSPGTAVNFIGGGLTYNNLTLTQPSITGTLSINNANTFNTFTSNKTVSYKLNLVNGLTNTFTTFVCNGSLGKIFAINSTSPGNAAGLSVTNSFTADYVAVTDVSLTSLNGVVTNGYLQYTTAPVFGWTLGTGSQYYRALTSGTLWQVPTGFSSPNIVHILGGGGGGSGGSIASVTSTRAGGAGGGGGGYAQLVNQSYTAGSGIGYSIGSAGSAGSGATGGGTSTGGTGGTTSWGALQNTITFVAAELSVQNTSSTSITVTVPAGVSNGDLMLMMVTSASSPSWTTPSGWTLGGSGSQGRALFYRTASSEPANYVVTGSVSSTHDAYIVAYANATYDKQAGITLSSLSNPTTPAAITLATPNSTVLVVTKSTSGSVTFTTPTGYTVVSSDSDSTAPSTAVFSASISAAGTYTAPSSTLSSGSGYSYIVALSPTLGSYSTTASGGTGGVSAGGLTSTAGTGGTGSGGSTNYTGGTGGIGGNTTTVSVATGGGGGAGGAGPNGNGGNGGNGLANSLMAGGGGGGNGGGSAGANSTVANTGGNGGNNSLGVGGGTSSTSAFQGGGGVGGSGSGGGNGSAGEEIITVAGSGGGGGGSGSAGASAAAAGNYGAGGSGGSVSTTPTASSGGAGTQGLVLIIWTFTSGGFTANITENSSLADVLSILASYNVSQTEDSTLTENQNISAQFAASQTENSNLDDTTTQQANYIQSFTENVNIDDLKTVVAQFINSVTEAVTVDDIEQASLMFTDSISENLTAESIESIQATFVRLITENINAADLNSVKMDYLVAVFENAGLLDIICYNGWFKIDTNQSSAWSNVNDSQSAGWGSINTNQTANWNNIDPEQPCS